MFCEKMPLSTRRNGSHADSADTQIYRGLMRRISEKVSQITRITQIAIRAVFPWIRGRYAPKALTDYTDFTD